VARQLDGVDARLPAATVCSTIGVELDAGRWAWTRLSWWGPRGTAWAGRTWPGTRNGPLGTRPAETAT